MSINNRPLDGESLIRQVDGLLGEPNYIGTEALIAFFESLASNANSQLSISDQTVANTDRLLLTVGGMRAQVQRQLSQINTLLQQVIAEQQVINNRLAQVEAICLSNLVR